MPQKWAEVFPVQFLPPSHGLESFGEGQEHKNFGRNGKLLAKIFFYNQANQNYLMQVQPNRQISSQSTGRRTEQKWWVMRVTIPRPIRCKRIALPTELITHESKNNNNPTQGGSLIALVDKLQAISVAIGKHRSAVRQQHRDIKYHYITRV